MVAPVNMAILPWVVMPPMMIPVVAPVMGKMPTGVSMVPPLQVRPGRGVGVELNAEPRIGNRGKNPAGNH